MERRKFVKNSAALLPLVLKPEIMLSKISQPVPNVLILGDSISIGYTPFVQEKLSGKANIYRPVLPGGNPENCEGTTKGVKEIDRWLNENELVKNWDIIHFNFGLHDIKHVDPVTGENSKNPSDPQQANVKQYKKNLETIVEKLKASNARLVFATTTPYPDIVEGPVRKPGMPQKYNRAAIKIMNNNKIQVNDLYAFMLPRMNRLQLPNNVHFTPEGYKELGAKVAERILEIIRDRG
jgi:acyl-CoA thioesterase-1